MAKKSLLVLGVMLVFLISFVNGESTISKVGEDIQMQITTEPDLKIIKQTGDELLLDFSWAKIKDTNYNVMICHKDFSKNKNKFKTQYKIKTKKVKNKPPKDKNVNMKNNMCQIVDLDFDFGEIIKFGDESTEIILSGDNVTINVIPEYKECDYLRCESEIEIKNYGDTNISIYSDDLAIQTLCNDCVIETSKTIGNESFMTDAIEGFPITIPKDESQIFYFKIIYPDEDTQYKYNVSFFYINQTYVIDPFFNTTDSDFDENSSYVNTSLNPSGYVELNNSFSTGRYTQILNVSEYFTANWKTLIWESSGVYDTPIPENSIVETDADGLNMSGNQQFLHLNNDSGLGEDDNTFVDVSGKGNDAYCNATGTSCPVYDTGYDGLSLKFDGIDDYVVIDDGGDAYTETLCNNGCSFCFWFKKNSTNTGGIFSSHSSGTDEQFRIRALASRKTRFVIYKGDGILNSFATSVSTFTLDEWTHNCLVYEGGNGTNGRTKIYWNGEFDSQGALREISASHWANTSVPTVFGYINHIFPLEWYDGWIDEFFILNKPLTADEVENVYKRNSVRFTDVKVKACETSLCNESFTTLNISSPQSLSLPETRFFQYQFDFQSDLTDFSPDLHIVQVEYDNLTACVEDWIVDPIVCLINDTYFKTYTNNNSECLLNVTLPVDNGTYSACNYCSEDLEAMLGVCNYINGSYVQSVSYQDNNYFSCCALTGLISDCSIDYSPYNVSSSQVCNTTLENDFDISVDLELFFGFGIGGLASDKVSGKIWINDTNTTYYCVSYVETPDGNLLQTNPPYTKRVESTLSIVPKEIEDREFFITKNGLANVYWTDENLIIDARQYVFGVECAGDGLNLKSEALASVFYENVNAPVTRWFWFKENVFSIMLFMIILLVIVLVAGYYIRELKGK